MQQNVLIFKSQETNYRKHFSNNYEICSEKGERAYEKKEETASISLSALFFFICGEQPLYIVLVYKLTSFSEHCMKKVKELRS